MGGAVFTFRTAFLIACADPYTLLGWQRCRLSKSLLIFVSSAVEDSSGAYHIGRQMSSVRRRPSVNFFEIYLLQFLMDPFENLHTDSMTKGPQTNGEFFLIFLIFNPFRAIFNFFYKRYLLLQFLLDSFLNLHIVYWQRPKN